MDIINEENRRLNREYPFLIPRNVFSDEPLPETDPHSGYVYTLLDDMPDGWRKAFGEQLCSELKAALIKAGRLEGYRILQIKEKYGELRWYARGGTEETKAIIDKYTEMSRRTCIKCGKLAKYITRGWIEPFCEECLPIKDGAPFPHRLIEE